MFRCHKTSFFKLVDKIKDNINPIIFKSDEFLLNNNQHNTAISGEVKILITIRMLAGASYLDLLMSYTISQITLYNLFHETLQ